MEALSAITTIKNGSISFKELENLNNQEVEVFVFSINGNNSKEKELQKRRLRQFQGIIASSFTDTSRNVDKIVYGK